MSDQLNRDAILADYHFYARIVDDLRRLIDHIPGLLGKAAERDDALRRIVAVNELVERAERVSPNAVIEARLVRAALDTGRIPDMDRSKP